DLPQELPASRRVNCEPQLSEDSVQTNLRVFEACQEVRISRNNVAPEDRNRSLRSPLQALREDEVLEVVAHHRVARRGIARERAHREQRSPAQQGHDDHEAAYELDRKVSELPHRAPSSNLCTAATSTGTPRSGGRR